VVIPRAEYAPESVVNAFLNYIGAGGIVLAVGDCFANDQHGHARMERLRQAGAGRLVSLPYPLSSRAYREILDTLLDESGAHRPIRLEGEYGEPVWGVNLRTAERDGKLLVNLINFSRDEKRVRLVRTQSIGEATNLFTQQLIQFPLTLKPLDPRAS